MFRVDATPLQQDAETIAAVAPLPTEASTGTGASVVPAVGASRRGAVTNDRRPGPVIHIVDVVPPHTLPVAVEPLVPLNSLRAALVSVEPTLELIQRAQGFEVLDPRFPAIWEQLANAVERIRADIDSLLRSPRISQSRKASFLP